MRVQEKLKQRSTWVFPITKKKNEVTKLTY